MDFESPKGMPVTHTDKNPVSKSQEKMPQLGGIFENSTQQTAFETMKSTLKVDSRTIARALITNGPDILVCVNKYIAARSANKGGLDLPAQLDERKKLKDIFETAMQSERAEQKKKMAN